MKTLSITACNRLHNYILITALYILIGLITIAEFPMSFPIIAIIGLCVARWLFKIHKEPSLLLGNLILVIALSFQALIWVKSGQFDIFDFMTELLLIALVVKYMITKCVNDFLWLEMTLFFLVAAVAISTTSLIFVPFLIGYLLLQGQLFHQWNALRLHEIGIQNTRTIFQNAAQDMNRLGVDTRWDNTVVSEADTALSTLNIKKNWRMLSLTIVMCIMLALPVFFYIPRFSTNTVIPPVRLSTSLFDHEQNETGFTDTVDLGWEGTDIGVSMEVVAYARPDNPPRKMQIRLRGTALDDFDGKRWQRTTFAFPHAQTRRFSRGNYPMQGLSIVQTSKCGKYIFSESFIDRLMRPKGFQVFIDSDAGAYVLANDSIGHELRYKVNSNVEYLESRVNPEQILKDIELNDKGEYPLASEYQIDPAYYQKCITFPTFLDKQKMLTLLASWVSPQQSPFETAIAAERHFQMDYTYGLKTSAVPSNEQPVEWFMYNNKVGHCEFFASAMALLLRAKGIPARVVTGYVSNEWNSGAEAFVIRQGDAHSWVEVYFDHYGWMTFDPTPASGISQRAQISPWMRKWMGMMDSMRMQWYRNFIDYDITNQYRWIGQFDNVIGRVIFYPRYLFQTWSRHQQGIWTVVWIAMAVGSFVVFMVMSVLLWWKMRLWKSPLKYNITSDLALPNKCKIALYRQVLIWLKAHLGFARKANETPLEFAERVTAPKKPASITEFFNLTRLYYKVRYGNTVLNDRDKQTFEDFINRNNHHSH